MNSLPQEGESPCALVVLHMQVFMACRAFLQLNHWTGKWLKAVSQ
ncbi:hypothetical protein [Pseudomonas sp. LP_7_YM]|nr:hypothetical protein [Pseudomonas sp. LP_7_YM]TDV63463.1 hypothetical protein EC915_106230 [Pseudomonas sp. LP_7_YM]